MFWFFPHLFKDPVTILFKNFSSFYQVKEDFTLIEVY